MLRGYALRILCGILIVVGLCLTVQCVRVRNLKQSNVELAADLRETRGELKGVKAGLEAVEKIEKAESHRVEILTRNISDVRSQPVTTACVGAPSVDVALERLRQARAASGDSRQPADLQAGS